MNEMSRTLESFYVRRERWIQKLLTDPKTRTPAATRDVGALLATMMRHDQPFAYPTNQTLSDWTGHKLRSVERAIASLKGLKYLRVQSGGINFGTGRGFSSRYFLIFDKSDNFQLSADEFLSSAANEFQSSAANAPSPLADESVRMRATPACFRTPAPRPAEAESEKVENQEFGFSEFINLASEFNKVGDAREAAIRGAYRAALSYDGVTAESLVADYREHLEKRRGKSYSGHYAIKFLQDARNYTGVDNEAERPVERRDDTGRADSAKPSLTPQGKAKRLPEFPRSFFIRQGVFDIDTEKDGHWTDSGFPTLPAAAAASRLRGVTQHELESALAEKGWRGNIREMVRKHWNDDSEEGE